jgi:hypothetical protein
VSNFLTGAAFAPAAAELVLQSLCQEGEPRLHRKNNNLGN